MKVADQLVKCLEQQGVAYMFGVPGEENIDLFDALRTSSIQFILCHHETNAAFIAGIIGKLTGKPAVCVSTLGPGATNMVTGVACATLDRMPLVAITAQTDTLMQREGSHQYINIMGLYYPITKQSTSIREKTNTPDIVSEAFALAVRNRPGAIHIELSNDIASLQVQETPVPSSIVSEKQIVDSEQIIDPLAEAINQAANVLVFIGNGAVHVDSATILSFIEKLNAPSIDTFMAKGVIPGNHPLHLQTIGLPEGDFVNSAFDYADLVITIGYDTIEYGAQKWNTKAVPIIHINNEGFTDGNFYPVKASLVGDIATNLQQLTEKVERKTQHPPFLQLKKTITTDLQSKAASNAFPMVPQRIINDIQEVLSSDDILISDVGAHKLWIGRQYEALHPNTCIISNGLASMGIALPFAIGAKLVYPDKKVMAVCGDGSFIMAQAELATAVRLHLSIVILIWVDNRYSAIEWEQVEKLGQSSNIQFDTPDFVALAIAYGAEGYKVEEASELVVTLNKAFSSDGPVIVQCPVDYTENFRLSERLKDFKKNNIQ